MTLTLDEYVWCVAYTSFDSGRGYAAAYFTDRAEAEPHKNKSVTLYKAGVVQTSLASLKPKVQ